MTRTIQHGTLFTPGIEIVSEIIPLQSEEDLYEKVHRNCPTQFLRTRLRFRENLFRSWMERQE